MEISCKETLVFSGTRALKESPLTSHANLICCRSFERQDQFSIWTINGVEVGALNGHACEISVLCFGNSTIQPVVASACKRIVNVWHISQNGDDTGCTQVGKDLGIVTHLAFSPDDTALLVVIQNEIWVINVQTSKLITSIAVGDGNITVAEFCPVKPHLVIALCEGRTYNICDLNEQVPIYKSSIISGSSFLSLSMHPCETFFATGSTDGMVRIFDMSLYNSIHEFNVAPAIGQVCGESDIGCSIITLKYWNRSKPLLDDDNVIRVVVQEELYLAAACTSSVFILNANSMEMLSLIQLSEIKFVNSSSNLSAAANIVFGISSDDKLTMVISSLFSNEIHICCLKEKEGLISSNLTVLSLEPLLEDSPLKAKGLSPKVKQGDKKMKKPSKVDKMNQPLVFHGRIRSSGYSKDKPRDQMFQPKVNKPKAKVSSYSVGPWVSKTEVRLTEKDYPMESPAPTNLTKEQVITQNDSGINYLSFSDSGKSLACANADYSAFLLKTSTMKSILFNGHNGAVNSALMNHENNILITSSDDSTVKLWVPDKTESILDMSNYKHNFKCDSVKGAVDNANPRFSKSISRAQFYYLEKFIMISYGNCLLLYNYYIDPEKNDVKRYKMKNKYKLVKEFEITTSQKVTAFSAINSFYSYISICACSNRDLVIYDVNKSQPVLTINDAHTCPVQSLCQNQGSAFVTQTSEAYDLFITAAVSDGVKLWDLRLNRCVRKFEGHVNRAYKVGLAYSPCSRFIAVGSEDNSAYLYDIRAGSYLHRLSGHSNVVTALAFHPQYPLLACGTLSGKLRTYDVK